MQLCHAMEFVINIEKSDPSPRQLKFLETLINLVEKRAFPVDCLTSRFRNVLMWFVDISHLPAQLWQQVFGCSASLEKLVPRPIFLQGKTTHVSRHYPMDLCQLLNRSCVHRICNVCYVGWLVKGA